MPPSADDTLPSESEAVRSLPSTSSLNRADSNDRLRGREISRKDAAFSIQRAGSMQNRLPAIMTSERLMSVIMELLR